MSKSSNLLKNLHKPCDKLDKYDNEPYMKNPLLKLKLSDIRSYRQQNRLEQNAAKNKIQLCRKPSPDDDDEDNTPNASVNPQVHINKLRFYARNTPIPKMLKSTEQKIISYAEKRLRDKYPSIVNEYMSEVHEEHDRLMKAFSMNKLLKPLPDDFVPPRDNFQFKRLGRTENYENFLKNRLKIQSNLMLLYPFVRCIHFYSNIDFPHILNNFGKYRGMGEMGIHDIRDFTKKDLAENSAFIKKVWYPKIVKIMKNHYGKQNKYRLTRKQWQKAWNCATGLIVRQINDLKMRTIEHLNAVILQSTQIPFLKIIAICENHIDLCPTVEEIFEMYHSFIDIINEIGNNLDPLEILIDKTKFDNPRMNIKIELGDIILQNAHEKIQESLEISYAPIETYLNSFQAEFLGLHSDQVQRDLDEYLAEPREFDEYFEAVKGYQEYINKLKIMVQKEYFNEAIISQSDAIGSLKKIGEGCIKRITDEIIIKHKQEIRDICGEYEQIKSRALEVPKSTEHLFETGEYLLNVKKTTVDELGERIRSTLNITGYIVELADMDQEHTNLQLEVVNWYNYTPQIFELGGSNFEAMKYQFEEKLSVVSKQMQERLKELAPNLAVINDMTEAPKFKEYGRVLQKFTDEIIVFDDHVKWLNKEEALFKFPKTQSSLLEDMKSFVIPFAGLMKLCIRWYRYYDVWMDGCFEYLDPKFVQDTTEEFLKDFQKTQKFYRNKIKSDTENPECKFKGQLEDPDVEKLPAPLKICARMIQTIKDFRIGVHVVTIMCNPALRERHWIEMSEVAQMDLQPDAGTTLRKIINYNLQCLDECEIISIGACKELQLQQNLAAMMHEWDNVNFTTSGFKNTGITILSSIEEVQALLDDHIIKTLTMRGSAFVKPSEQEVKDWFDKLFRVQSTIEQWGKVQSTWLYLLPIFSSKDIVAQMSEEGRLFTQVNNIYKRYMMAVSKDPNVMETAAQPGLLEAMTEANNMLENVLTGVNNYLERKRLFFPRFFFLSNDEMLEILSETKNPLRVQPHLNKCFEGINTLKFNDTLEALAMISVEKEEVAFVEKVSTEAARGSVEKWLSQVEQQMLTSIKDETTRSWQCFNDSARTEWITKWPGMVVLAVSQIYWAADIESHLATNQKDCLKEYYNVLQEQLQNTVALIRSKTISNINRITVKALIVIDVHAKDVVEELVKIGTNSENDFQWMRQMRYSMVDEAVQVKIINSSVPYAYEYLGNSDRLVITPLTDRCYITLMSAYQLHLNGAPEGPAGTGKTETTKDLAKALAVQCKVFNCSEGLDYKSMGKFFKGLASSGAWACFDEFNRIDLEVLSVIAQQILSIVQAVRSGVENFIFEGTELRLNPLCYVCITMNPGYAGRSELPDNLKVLFRSIAMMVPDYALIGEISLYSYGFVNARVLSVKIVTTYRLCSEQLSSQNHYDYGMRAVKTVLQACGNLKKQFPDEREDILLLRSLLDVNLPKFLSFDVPLFHGIISDLFPNVTLPEADYTHLTEAFNEVCESLNLQPKVEFLVKVIQTYEMLIVRHGFMMVGEPFSGKTCTLKVLAECLSRLNENYPDESHYYQKVQWDTVNPKSITMGQLYGAFDPISYEWSDGIAATMFRNYANDPSPDRKWVVFDGPVSADWIENMNTVLDDNKKLCLTSGEVITMSAEMSMIFEVMDLAQASPATVSRCGMIYMEAVSLGWESFALSWLNNCNPIWANDEHKPTIMATLKWIFPDCLSFMKKNCYQFLKPGDINIVMTTLSIFEMLLNDACEENPEEYSKFVTSWFQAAISYAIMWGFSGIMDTDSRAKFDEFYREIWNSPLPHDVGKVEVSVPTEGQIIDYVYIFKQKGAWKYWPDLVRNMKIENGVSIQIPTIDTARYSHLFNLHFKYQRPFLMVGPTGTGKSFYIQNNLMKLPEDKYSPAFVTFTTQITANQVQELIISKLVKRRKGVYGAPQGHKCVLFIDDMNMPSKDTYGAQPPIELMRQYFDKKHWYDTKDVTKIHLQDLMVVAACGLVGGSRQDVYARFLCHFNIFAINLFSDETNFKIFHSLLLDIYKRNGHAADVINNCNSIVNATIDVYNFAITQMLPTPAKSHYVFNLRDISRVVGGCALLRKESTDTKKMFAKIWFHEVQRVFFDRLIDNDDRQRAFDKLSECIKVHFKDKLLELFDDLATDGKLTHVNMNGLLFGSYFDMDTEYEERKYEIVQNVNALRKLAYQCLEEYNSTHKTKMDIVLFEYALQHLNKICRIMSLPGGSGLLVGMGGSGRQSMTQLAAAILNQSLFQPEITKNYGLNEFRDDLKLMLKEAGGYGKDTVFLFTEGQMKMEEFLQDIDCLLNLGEVPNIFQIDEKQEVLELVRLAAQGGNRNLDIPPLQVFQFFVNRCKQKLHLILCFSPIGSSFRNRLRLYPSLVNCCTIDWYDDWPEDALEMVAQKYIKDVDIPDETKGSVVQIFKHFHMTALKVSADFLQETGRITYFTSASYLELIKLFCNLIARKQKNVIESKMRYLVGLDRLKDAAETVALMQVDLEAKQPQLIVLAEESRIMMEQIEKESIEAELAAEQVKRDELVANKQAAESLALNAECEKDLASAIPILEDAIQSLNTLKPTDITLVKSMKNPPDTVKLVMAAVCVMKSVPPDKVADPTGKKILDYWGPSKRLLGDIQFLQYLKEYDKDNIKPEIMAKIRKDFISHKDFHPHIVAKASSAAEGLCKWIIAMDLYDAVAKVVAPKKAKLEESKRKYEETMSLLIEKRDLAMKLEQRVIKLNNDLDEATLRRQAVEDEVEMCRKKLVRAETLLGSLGGERDRWVSSAGELQLIYDCLPGDILISCGLISYLSSFTTAYRVSCVTDWYKLCSEMKIPQSLEFNFIAILGSEIRIQNWNICGLPRDTFSIENGIIMENSSRYSLFIDPQNQANKCLKEMERNNDLHVVKLSQSDYMKKVEYCLEHGHPVLIESILETLDAPLDPLLKRQTFKHGGNDCISLGDNVIQVSPNFRLYMTTTLRNPHYLPEIFNKVTIVNFALTQQGLEDQLSGIVVAKERPDLDELRQNLIKTKARNQEMLKNVEDDILRTLSESTGDILEDESAIKMLDDSKSLAVDIKLKQEESVATELQLETFRESYKQVATHAATIYYSITDLPNIDPMYQFSLSWYISLFIYSIENANKSKHIVKRLKFLIDAVTVNLYNNVCRSLFEKDKTLFAFILTSKIMISNNQMTISDLQFLLNEDMKAYEMNGKNQNPDPSWLPEKIWSSILRLRQIRGFQGFVEEFPEHIEQWKKIYDDFKPEEIPLPGIWESKLTTFEKLLLLRAIRPDKLTSGISIFIERQMGSKFVSPPPFDISKSFEDSNCLTPVIFILSPGVDPMQTIVSYAEKLKFDETFQSVSLGQGQGMIAQRMIEKAKNDGGWVCLQNCHLAESWMPTLESLWEEMDMFNTDSTFRLWLTAYPSKSFPTSILQNGVKITNEPPTGLQKNLLRSYNSEPMSNVTFYASCPDKDRAFTKLLYGICFFHAVVQERRNFGSLGWNILYGFNESDFQISVQQLQLFLNQYEEIPYDAISYLTGECNYGGRVTDAWDRRTIVTILRDFVNEAVVLDPVYKFTKFDEIYTIPRRTEHREVVKHINETIPNDPSPEIFGLHPNAGLIRDLNMSTLMLDTLSKTQVKAVKLTSEEEILINMVNAIQEQLPRDFDIDEAQAKYPIDYNESMNTVLVQEMERFNILLREIRTSCKDLQDGVLGRIVMTPLLEEISGALILNKIPSSWMKKSYPSLKRVGSYIKDFVRRLSFFQQWFDIGKPTSFWLSGFYFTQAFLTGVMQNYARKFKLPIDTLTFDFEILNAFSTDQISERPADGVYVYGLFIEGGRWDETEKSIVEQEPKVIINDFPMIHFISKPQSEFKENFRYKSPLYKTAERKGILSTTGHSTNYVIAIMLDTKVEPEHWIKRGVALLCQNNE